MIIATGTANGATQKGEFAIDDFYFGPTGATVTVPVVAGATHWRAACMDSNTSIIAGQVKATAAVLTPSGQNVTLEVNGLKPLTPYTLVVDAADSADSWDAA